MATKTNQHYVDNTKFRNALIDYRNSYLDAIRELVKYLEDEYFNVPVEDVKIRKRKVEVFFADETVSFNTKTEEFSHITSKFKKPRMSNYIGKCFMLIAGNIANLPCFRGYPFIDDMISDALENMVMYAHNYDDTVSPYAFSYFNIYAYRCFFRKITAEKKLITMWNRYVDSASWETFFEGNYDSVDDIPGLEQIRVMSSPDKKLRKFA